jgi:hypothetical protein
MAYPPPYPPAYPSPYPAYPPRNSTTAVISLIAGIAGWSILPVLGSIVAIFTGHIAKAEIRGSMGQISGGGMATAGLIMGYLQIILLVCSICTFGVLILLGLVPAVDEIMRNLYHFIPLSLM